MKAATSLHDKDIESLTTTIEDYIKAGVVGKQAETLAVDDLISQVKQERETVMALVREQHPELFGAAEALQAQAEAKPDRNSFTLQRLNRETNTMEPVTFERGEYVQFSVGEGGKRAFGEIDGISHAKRQFSVEGLWYDFGFANKAERPQPAAKAGTAPLAAVIDKVNKKNGAGLGPADAVSLLEAFKGTMNAVYDGTASVEDYKTAYQRVRDAAAMKAELGKLTKDALIRTFGIMARPDEKKDSLIDTAYKAMLRGFALGKEFGPRSYMMTRGGLENYERLQAEALDAIVQGHTADDLAAYAAEVKAAREERASQRAASLEAIKNPKTLEEFRQFMSFHTRDGKTTTEVRRSMLTPEQRAAFDLLLAENVRSRRTKTKDEDRSAVKVAGQTVDGEIIATKHTKRGHDLFVVRLSERVSREDYDTLNASAKRMGGYYSSYRGGGAIAGFQFTERDQAEAFVKLAQGDKAEAQAVADQRRDAYADDRSQTAAERLAEMADRMEADADESLALERKANTARRARFAASAEAFAREAKAMAKTMRNVAQALKDGTAKFLDRIRTKTQVQLLQTYVANAQGEELRAKYPTYAEQEKRRGQPPTQETADYAEFPTYTAFRSDLASLGRQLQEVDGTKKLGDRLMKVADDVSDAFTAWAKEPGNLFRLSAFSMRRGDEVKTAIFKHRENAESAIKRSGLSGKAIVFAEKRGVNRIVMSPSEAIAKGIWQGDGDKRITLSDEFGAELVEQIGRVARRGGKVSVPWQFERAYERLKQLERMGIETAPEFRAALREFIGLREQAAEADRIKVLERAMIGRRNDGLDFFPTSESVADEMVAAADIKPGMRVLEPSAGMGHIAERIRGADVEPEVVEYSNDRRELLEAKGFNVIGTDFLNLSQDANGEFDRILMNPPFSEGRDIEHVRHAFGLLKPGGRLVAIMGESAFFNQNKRATEFRDWLERMGGTDEKLPEGSFMDPSLPVNTAVNARMVVIDKPESAQEGAQDSVQGSDAAFSRQAGRGVPMEDARALTAAIREALPTAPPIVLHDSVDKVPDALRQRIYSEGAQNDVEAVYYGGEIHVFPHNMASLERMQFVVAHHEIRHHGVKAMLGPRAGMVLLSMARSNPRLMAAAKEVIARGHADTMVRAVDEALADMPVEDVMALTGWDKVVSTIRQWLRDVAAKLRRTFPGIADTIDPKTWTDRDIAHFVLRAEAVSRGGSSLAMKGAPAFSRSAMKDSAANIKRGAEAMNRAIVEKTDQHRAMFRNGLGWVDFVWGDGKKGIAHVFQQRMAKDGMTRDDVTRMLTVEVIEAIASGTEIRRRELAGSIRAVVALGDQEVVLVRNPGSNTWMLNGWVVSPGANAPANDNASTTQPAADSSDDGRGAEDGESVAMFSRKRSYQALARTALSDMLSDAGAKVNVWERTVGTQYAKAERHPEFKPVFDTLQEYQEATSTLANEAADLAPGILPKLETWKDFANIGISKADAEAIAGPLFEGTLNDSRVYDDAELKTRFGLNDQQRDQYRAVLASVNASLDQAVAADTLKLLGLDDPALRDMVANDRPRLRRAVTQYLEQLADAGDQQAADSLKAVNERYDRVDALKRQGYMPLMRFGRYKVHIGKDGKTEFFGLYESKRAANKAARELMEDPEFAGAKLDQGVLSEEAFKLFAGLPLDSMEMFAQAIGADKAEVFQKYIKLTKNNRSALKRLMKRKGTAGFSQDVPRVLAAFITSNARLAAGSMHLQRARKMAETINAGDVQDEAIKLLEAVENPTDTAGKWRGLMFANFIGGSIASALVNVTQPITMTLPYLSQFGGIKKAGARLMAAGGMVASGKLNDPALAAALKRAEDDGIVSPQEIHHLTAQAMSNMGTNPWFRRAAFIWSAPFSVAEQFNRRVSFVAAYQTARQEGIKNPFEFAQRAVIETQGLYNKGNVPNWARNPLGAAALTFKQFSVHYIEWATRMYRSGPEGKRAVLYAMVILALAAGVEGLPFAEDLMDVVDTLGQAAGYDTNSKRTMRDLVANTLGFGDIAGDVFARGFSALPGMPMDVSIRMGMGNMLPATGLFLASNTDRSRDVLEIAGAAGGQVKQYMDAGQKLLEGDIKGGALGAVPIAFQNAAKGIGMWITGEARDNKDRRIMEADITDGLMRFLGFNPAAIARESDKLSMMRRSEQLAKNVEGDIASEWARAFADGDTDGVAKAKARLADWNDANPGSQIRITGAQILQRVKKLRQERAQRFITSVSPERRANVSGQLQ